MPPFLMIIYRKYEVTQMTWTLMDAIFNKPQQRNPSVEMVTHQTNTLLSFNVITFHPSWHIKPVKDMFQSPAGIPSEWFPSEWFPQSQPPNTPSTGEVSRLMQLADRLPRLAQQFPAAGSHGNTSIIEWLINKNK